MQIENSKGIYLLVKNTQKHLVNQEIQEMLKKGAIKKVSFKDQESFSAIYLWQGKKTGESPNHKSKKLKLFHSTSTNQNERFTLSEILPSQKRLSMQDIFKRCVFSSSPQQMLTRISSKDF